MCYSGLQCVAGHSYTMFMAVVCVAGYCSVLRRVAVRCRTLAYHLNGCRVCCRVLQCVAACRSALQDTRILC